MPIASRLTNTGTLLVNGSFDEVTFNNTNPSIKNLAVYSQDTSTGTGRWTGYGRAANNQNYDYAPDGTFTAVRILESADSVNALHGWGQSQTNYEAGNRYTISMYLKSYSADRNFMYGVSSTIIGGTASNYVYADCNPDTGVVGNALVYAPASQTTSVTNVGNGWYRFSLSFLAANTATSGVDIQFRGGAGRTTQSYIGNGTSGILFWGLQIEKSSSPTIYQGIAAAGTLVTPTFKTKNTVDSIYSTGVFDEVTTLDVGVSKREDSSGNLYLKNNFDEFTGAPVVDSSLQLWLDAGQTTSYSGSGTTWTDISGSGYNLFGQAGGGSAPTFNISPGTFSINSTTKLGFNTSTGSLSNLDSTTFSIEAWVLHTSFNSNGHYNNMISLRETYYVPGPGSGFRFGVNTPLGLATDTTGRPKFWTDQSGGTIATGGTTWPISLNTWYQVTITYTGTTCLTYINGSLFNSSTGTYVAPTGRFLYIGTNAQGLKSLNGQISAYKWYTRALTADEITTNFNALRNRYGI